MSLNIPRLFPSASVLFNLNDFFYNWNKCEYNELRLELAISYFKLMGEYYYRKGKVKMYHFYQQRETDLETAGILRTFARIFSSRQNVF